LLKNGAEDVTVISGRADEPGEVLSVETSLTTIVYAPETAQDAATLESLLDALLEGRNLSTVVLVSAFTAALGRAGHSTEAAEAAVLESIAHRLRADGRSATYVAWHHRDDLPAARPVPVRAAMAAIRRAVGQGSAAAAVVDADWKSWDHGSA